MTSSANSLIMGVAAGYPNGLILPFLKSLRMTSYAGKVCLFVGGISDEAVTELRTLADDVIILDGIYGAEIDKHRMRPYAQWLAKVKMTRRVRRLYPLLFRAALRLARPDSRKKLQLDLEQCLEGFQSLRYWHYRDYLDNQAPAADFVMLSDVRDVVFQGDPFSHPFDTDLEVFLEAPHLQIGSEPFNSRWIRELYGPDALTEFRGLTISCSGTTMGTRAGIRRYLTQMIGQVTAHAWPLGSHDQGIHNYLLRQGRLDPVTIYENGFGPVLTMSLGASVSQNTEGQMINQDRQVPAVVHQYDRHPGLAEHVWQRYS